MEFWFEVAAKVVSYAALLLLLGALGAQWLLLPQLRQQASAAGRSHDLLDGAVAAFHRLALVCAGVLAAGLALRVVAHTVAAFGAADAWSVENLTLIALESRWGTQWQQQMLVSLALIATALLGLAQPVGCAATALVAVALCFLIPLIGHAEGEPARVVVHGLHILVGGLWLGTLAAVVVVRAAPVQALRAPLLEAFAPVAMGSVTILGATGAFAAWTYLGGIANLWTTEYGRLLLVKLFLVVDALTLGGLNWMRIHRQRQSPLEAFAIAEVVTALAIVIVTAWLTETGHP